jgi:hypothetical protein
MSYVGGILCAACQMVDTPGIGWHIAALIQSNAIEPWISIDG